MAGNQTIKHLASMPRAGSIHEPHRMTKISVDEFTGDDGRKSRYLQIRVWECSDRGNWSPSRVGMTIRKSEFEPFIEAVNSAYAYMVEGAAPREAKRKPRAK